MRHHRLFAPAPLPVHPPAMTFAYVLLAAAVVVVAIALLSRRQRWTGQVPDPAIRTHELTGAASWPPA